MSKKNKEQPIIHSGIVDDFTNLYQNKYVKKMEFIIINYLDNIKSIAKYDTGLKNNLIEYEKDIVNFIIEYNHSRGFHLNLNQTALTEIWLSIRERSNNQVHFITQITSTFISSLDKKEYNELVEHIAYAYSCITEGNKEEFIEYNIIRKSDYDYYKRLPTYDLVYAILKSNPWVLTLILINQMDTILR